MAITVIPGPHLIVDGHPAPSAVLDEVRDWLGGRGLDEWAVHDAMARVRVERAWYSDEYGFGHDCTLHAADEALPACAAQRPVVAVSGVPDALLEV